MAKYVCDFEEVFNTGDKLCQSAIDMALALNTYSSNINSDLSTWKGNAKSAFDSTNKTQISTSKADARYINSLGNFVKSSSKSIQSLEEELASLSI
jgi:uncharacterized protein YukE